MVSGTNGNISDCGGSVWKEAMIVIVSEEVTVSWRSSAVGVKETTQ